MTETQTTVATRRCVGCFNDIPHQSFCEDCGSYYRPTAVEESADTLVIQQKWRSQVVVVLSLAGVAVLLVLRFVAPQLLPDGNAGTFLFGGIAFVFGYWSTVFLKNETRVTITPDSLCITHGPIPFLRGRELERSQIEHFFVRTVKHSSQHGTVLTFDLFVQTGSGENIKLLKGLPESANRLKRTVQKHLGLENSQFKAPILFERFAIIVTPILIITLMWLISKML